MNTLPHFLCIGTQKAGTSWFFHQIRQHPDVWLPPIKELHFFDHLYCPENRSWTSRHIQSVADRILSRQRSKSKVNLAFVEYVTYLKGESMFTEKWYIRAFDRPGAKGKVTGDVTPS